MKQMLCKDCVNFLMHKKDICHCDFENWEDVPYKDALLLCGEMYGCTSFEELIRNGKRVELEVHKR